MVDKKNAQTWLQEKFENQKTSLKKIEINKGVELDGELEIKDYPALERILLNSAKGVKKMTIENCPNIRVIVLNDNQTTEIKGLESLTKLEKLNINGNKFKQIDVSKNTQLTSLNFDGNLSNLQFVNGLENLDKLDFLISGNTFPITNFLKQASQAELKAVANKLELKVEGKTKDEIKQEILAELEKNNQNKKVITNPQNGFPNLFNEKGEVSESELAKIKSGADQGQEYQKLVDEATNGPIKSADGKKIDQAKLEAVLEEIKKLHDPVNDKILSEGKLDQNKLNKELEASGAYANLKEKNPNLIVNGQIDQGEIDKLKNSSQEANDATGKLGVANLKEDLEAKLGGSKLSDIPTNLKDLLEKVGNLENLIKKAGIDPNDAGAAQKIEELKNRPTRKEFDDLKGEKGQLEVDKTRLENEKRELEKRPTSEELNQAVKKKADEFEGWINPNDKTKLEEAAKKAGFIDPKDNSALEKAAKEQGKAIINQNDLNSLQQRPDITNDQWNNANHKVQDYESGLKDKLGLTADNWKDGIDKLKNQTEQIKGALGLGPDDPLPSDLKGKLVPKTDLDKANGELDSWKNKFPNETPDTVNKKITDASQDKAKLGEWQTKFPGQDPTQVKKDMDDLRAKAGGSGTGAALTPEQQQKLADYDKIKAQRDTRPNITLAQYNKIANYMKTKTGRKDWENQILGTEWQAQIQQVDKL